MSSTFTIRQERDPNFWTAVACHPAVVDLMGRAFTVEELDSVVSRPNVIPLASEHGGFLFAALDTSTRIYELHTLYTPEGWGREVHSAAKQAFNVMFTTGAAIVVTNEMLTNPRSQPPRSFGFRALGEFGPSIFGEARTWMLTRDAWLASPGGRSSCH